MEKEITALKEKLTEAEDRIKELEASKVGEEGHEGPIRAENGHRQCIRSVCLCTGNQNLLRQTSLSSLKQPRKF